MCCKLWLVTLRTAHVGGRSGVSFGRRPRPTLPQLLQKASYSEPMTKVESLSPAEEALWRATMRIVQVLPRHLDSDLIHGAGVSASDYTTLMHLSEAPNRELRMSDLASATGLSASRMTRLVDDLQTRALVNKAASPP